jgi:hypothetical protein
MDGLGRDLATLATVDNDVEFTAAAANPSPQR